MLARSLSLVVVADRKREYAGGTVRGWHGASNRRGSRSVQVVVVKEQRVWREVVVEPDAGPTRSRCWWRRGELALVSKAGGIKRERGSWASE